MAYSTSPASSQSEDPGFHDDQDEHAEMLEVLTIGDESFEQHRDVLQQDKVLKNTSLPPINVSKNQKNFADVCVGVYRKILQLREKYGALLVSTELWESVQKSKSTLDEDETEISISVFGQHNCGKSTFINALIGMTILPVKSINSTALTVKVRHSNDVHQVCDSKCETNPTKHCPQLCCYKKYSDTVITGRKEIYSYLQLLNDSLRPRAQASKQAETNEFQSLILKVYIPVLNEGLPPGWIVSLADNPGFGEARECITQVANASMVVSSAYIYLMHPGSVSGTAAAEFFKELHAKDAAALSDGRLIVGITHWDIMYTDETTSEEEIKAEVIQSIKSATGSKVSEDIILPICGKWLLHDSKLMSWLAKHSQRDDKPREIRKAAKKALKQYKIELPSGENETKEQMWENIDPKALLKKLEDASGMSNMKMRIQGIVGKTCIMTWARKLFSQFVNYIRDIFDNITKECDEKRSIVQVELKAYEESKSLLDEIKTLRRNLEEETTLDVTRVLKELGRSYDEDLKNSTAPELGKELVGLLVNQFKTKYKERVGNFSSSEFQASLDVFVHESRPQLQRVFGNFNFHHVSTCLSKFNGETTRHITILQEKAKGLVGHKIQIVTSEGMSRGGAESRFTHELSENFEKRILLSTNLYKPSSTGQDPHLSDEQNDDHPADDDTSSSPSCMTQSGSTFTTSTADIPTAPDALADKCSPTDEVTQDFVPDLATTGTGIHDSTQTDPNTDEIHTELESSMEVSSILPVDHHRDLCDQVCLNDLTVTGSVPEVSSASLLQAILRIAREVMDQFSSVKEKAKRAYAIYMGYSETSTSTSRQVEECNSNSSRVSSGRVHERRHRVTEYNGSIQPNVSVTSGRRSTHNQCEGTPDSSATPGLTVHEETNPTSDSNQSDEDNFNQDIQEVEDDNVSVTSAQSSIDSASNWGDEVLFDTAIKDIQRGMEDVCDSYFKEIKPHAVKFFQDKYKLNIKESLQMFDEAFKVPLQEKQKEINKQRQRQSELKSEISTLKKHRNDLYKLDQELIQVWEDIGLSLEGMAKISKKTTEQLEFEETQQFCIKELKSIFD